MTTGAVGGDRWRTWRSMELVDDVRDLPLTVSEVLAQVIPECDNADASVSSLARIMAGDQALAAMVLKLANSAYYGYARKIESLPDAVVLLGFASVKNLAITASITRLLASDRDELARVPRAELFDHSLCTAVGARDPRPHAPHLGREGVRRRSAARPRPDRARLLPQGPLPPDLIAAARGARARASTRSRTRSSASRTPSSAPSSRPSGSSRPALCEALRYHHDPAEAVVDPVLALAVHCGRLARQAPGRRSACRRSSPEWPHDPAAMTEFELDRGARSAARGRGPRRVPGGRVPPRARRVVTLGA